MMDLRSYSFIAFLLVSLAAYYLAPRRFQWLCLLLASLVFYAFSGVTNLFFILASSGSTFLGALAMASFAGSLRQKRAGGALAKDELKRLKKQVQARRRLVLLLALAADFGILAYLKYWRALPFGSKPLSGGLLLPLGISFYTFQTVAYLIDVYNGKYAAERNFLRYVLFVSFFPQLIQGPINRYDALGVQLREEHGLHFENVKRGVLLILFGAMKKYVVADVMAHYVSSIFDSVYDNLPGGIILMGILGYSVYQYADFSGGIDMVLGIARLFDLKMQPNFRQPYFSTSLADFWRRWHISLGLWMKDYLFYPLALTKWMQKLGKACGLRFGKHLARVVPAGIANIVVFFVVGIWHGPELHFVLWGLYNGLVIALGDLCRPFFARLAGRLRIPTKSAGFRLFQIVRTFIIVNIGWYFDRIRDVPKSFRYLRNTFLRFGFGDFLNKDGLKALFSSLSNAEAHVVLVSVGTLIIFITSVMKERQLDVYECIQRRNIVLRWCAYYFLLVLIILSFSFAPGSTGFMYAYY